MVLLPSILAAAQHHSGDERCAEMAAIAYIGGKRLRQLRLADLAVPGEALTERSWRRSR
jgi:hypothetical protein